MSIIDPFLYFLSYHTSTWGKSAIAVAGEFELTFTNTDVHKIICIWKTNQDNPHLICKMALKQNVTSYISVSQTLHIFLFLI